MAYINVDEVYILDNTGLQVDMATDIPFADAGFTDAQKEQARKNIAAGGTNPNLLDNPFFGNPVNQRGLTTYSGTGQLKTIDRWVLYNGSGTNSLTIKSGYISVRSDANGFAQLAEDAVGAALNGKTLTASILFNDGTVMSKTGVYNNSALVALGDGIYFGLVGGKQCLFDYTTGNGVTKDIKAVKLELGSVSTLANDVPPDYGTELLKCMRYFVRIDAPYLYNGFGVGRATSNAECRIFIPLPNVLRASPTVSSSAIGNLRLVGNGSSITPSAVSYSGRSQVGVNIAFTASGLTANQLYFIAKESSDCYIDLSADL